MSVSFDPKFIKFSVTSNSLLSGLVSYWKFNEDPSGNNAADEKGLHALPNTGVTQDASGKIGNAYAYSGTSSYTAELDSADYELTSALSVSLWMKSSTASTWKCLISNYDSSVLENGWDLMITNTDILSWSVRNDTQTPDNMYVEGSVDVVDGTWKHVVATFDGTYCRIYVNGTADGTSSAWNHPIKYVDSNNFFTIGRREIANLYTGSIDEVGIWNRALTQTEITSLYNSGSGRTYPFS
jgi:hypothetical protein